MCHEKQMPEPPPDWWPHVETCPSPALVGYLLVWAATTSPAQGLAPLPFLRAKGMGQAPSRWSSGQGPFAAL
eukprot:3578344-Pyramimonas_sp.AAC.2